MLRARQRQRSGQRHVEPALQAPYPCFSDLYDPVGSDSEYLVYPNFSLQMETPSLAPSHEAIGLHHAVAPLTSLQYSGRRGYAFKNWKRQVKHLLEANRPKAANAIYTATTQLTLIEATMVPYSRAATWMPWVRKKLAHDMALASLNGFPSMDLAPHVDGMEDDWSENITDN